MKDYSPPITLDEAILGFVAAIGETVGRLSALEDFERSLKLRRVNRVRTIHGSLSIEGNTLSEEQITAILQGKRVIAPPKEILEVKNALAVYERFPEWNPSQESDLLEAHRILMSGLIDQPGDYRSGGAMGLNLYLKRSKKIGLARAPRKYGLQVSDGLIPRRSLGRR